MCCKVASVLKRTQTFSVNKVVWSFHTVVHVTMRRRQNNLETLEKVRSTWKGNRFWITAFCDPEFQSMIRCYYWCKLWSLRWHFKNIEEWITVFPCNSCNTFLIWASSLPQCSWPERNSCPVWYGYCCSRCDQFSVSNTGGKYALEILVLLEFTIWIDCMSKF